MHYINIFLTNWRQQYRQLPTWHLFKPDISLVETLEINTKFNKPLYLNFVGDTKAFDSIKYLERFISLEHYEFEYENGLDSLVHELN